MKLATAGANNAQMYINLLLYVVSVM